VTAQFRWEATKPRPPIGARRTVAPFLWFPKQIGNDVRWFGNEPFIEEWQNWRGFHAGIGRVVNFVGWRAVEWVNK
jgi:hypothetical protein